MAAITAASALPEARVLRVLENAGKCGFEALYPQFPEGLPVEKPLDEKGLWKVIKEYLGKSPSKSGVSVSDDKWRPSTAADYLVHTGKVADVSVGQIADIIGNHKDRGPEIEIEGVGSTKKEYPFEFKEQTHEGKRRLFPFEPSLIFVALLAVFLGCAFLFSGDGHQVLKFLIPAGMAGALIAVVLIMLKQSLEWWMLQTVLASTKLTGQAPLSAGQLWKRWFRRDVMGLADAGGNVPPHSVRGILEARIGRKVPFLKEQPVPPPQPATPRRVNPLGTPKLTFMNARSLPEAQWDIDSISDSRNALGRAPIRTLYLWVFDAQDAQKAIYKEQGWLQLGPVHMLLNATALPLSALWGKGKDLLLKDPQSVDQWMAGIDDKAGWHPPSGLFGDRQSRTYAGYPLHTPLCSDGSWEHALHQLARRCKLAVVNLSGYDPDHPGLEYEIRHLLGGGPPGKFVFMYDHATDADGVTESVLSVWNEMEPPATAPELVFVRTLPQASTRFTVINAYQAQFGARRQKHQAAKQYLEKESAEFVPVAAQLVSHLEATGRFDTGESRILQAGD